MKTRGQYLTDLRLGKGWKKRPPLVAALKAQGVEITAEAIRQYENDEAKPKPDVRAGLAKVYGVSPADIEFAGAQPRSGDMELSAREEIIVELFRGYFDEQQKELVSEMRAMFYWNNYTRKELGVKELRGVSNQKVRDAFGDVPPPRQSKPIPPPKKYRKGTDEQRGAPVDDE